MKQSHWIVITILMGVSPGASASDDLRLVTYQDHSRLIFHIDESVPVEWKSNFQTFELTLKGIQFLDLGAPPTDPAQWKSRIENLKDLRVGSVSLLEEPNGVVIRGKWKYPSGKFALANPSMDFFHYREKNPTQYVVDFWVKEGPLLLTAKAAEREARIAAERKQVQLDQKHRLDRTLAVAKRYQDVEKSIHFCEGSSNELNDFFLEFYPEHQKFDFSKWFPAGMPDTDFSYFRSQKKTKDAQYVRLILDFYQQGKYALALRTLEFFQNEFPKSELRVEMRFLKANSFIKLGFNDEGEKILTQLMNEIPNQPVALHSAMFLTAQSMKRELPLLALEKFLWLIQHYPDNKLSWVFHLGAAECFYSIKQSFEASREYQWVIDHAPDAQGRSEAVARMGDLYLLRFQYEQALAFYSQGFHYFKEEIKQFSAFHLNWAEVLYQLGQYNRAQEAFLEFLAHYPNHPGGWRATFRLGEILARTGQTTLQKAESREWFYNTINRFPFSPGATLARLRLIPCEDHGGFNLETQHDFFEKEAKNYAGGGEVVMKNYPEFRALARVRTLVQLGTKEQAADSAILELKSSKNPLLNKILKKIAHENLRKVVLEFLDRGMKYEALSFYSMNAHLISGTKEGTNPDFLLKLSQAAADLRLGKHAQELAEVFRKASLSENQTFPSKDLHDLSQSEQDFSYAKAVWISSRDQLDTVEAAEIQKIRNILLSIPEESIYFYESQLILALLEQKEKKFELARAHLLRAQLLNPHPRMNAWLATLELKLENYNLALEVYNNVTKSVLAQLKNKKVENLTAEDMIGVPSTPLLSDLVFIQAEILEKQSRWGDLAILYSIAIDNGLNDSRIKYEYARSLLRTGKISDGNKAQLILEELSKMKTKITNEIFWKNLAQQTLADQKMSRSLMLTNKGGKYE